MLQIHSRFLKIHLYLIWHNEWFIKPHTSENLFIGWNKLKEGLRSKYKEDVVHATEKHW